MASPRVLPRSQVVVRWLTAVAALGLGFYYLVSSGAAALIVTAVLLCVLGGAIGWAFVVSRRRPQGSLYWRGFVSFDEDDFQDRNTFPYIIRTPRKSLGRQGLSGGKLELRAEGLEWRARSIATPRCEISGAFFLPWTSIRRADVGDIPGKSRLLGGSVRFIVDHDQSELYGEFLGSRRGLLGGLFRSPLGRS